MGVGFGLGSQNGFTLDLAANKGKGYSEGESVTHSNTAVRAGDAINLASGEDTNLKGAVVSANQVQAQVGGDLNLVSQQDIDNYKSKQQDASVGISLCIPPFCYGVSGSAAFSQQKIDSNYASVTEQTGIKAGDGGFQIEVKGNTDLKGAVIASTDKAVADGKNSLTTGTLTHSDIKNTAEYDASSLNLSGGYGILGKDRDGNASATAGGQKLPSEGGVSAGTPVVLTAGGEDSSKTLSGISGGRITITDEGKQRQLTGESADEAVAGINRDVSSDKDGSNALDKIFDREEIEAGFEITGQFVRNVGTFLDDRARASAAAKQELEAEQAKPADQQDGQKMAALILAIEDNKTWDVGGTGRALVSALSGAAGGNVTGSTTQMLQGAAINYLQGLAAEQVKHIADELDSEAARTALHAIVGCAGAAAQNQSCGSGALGAGASVVLNNLLDALNNDKSATEEEKQTRLNIVGSLIAGITSATGGDAAAAANAAQIETANNHLSDHEMRALARELNGCEQRKDCTPIAQAYMDKHLANKETFEKVCEVSMDACKIMASEMYDAIYKFQTLGYYSELDGQAADILLAFQQMNVQAQQDASGTITLPTAEAMVEAMGFNPKDEKAKAIILTIAAVVAGKAVGGPKGEVKLLPKPGSTTVPASGVGANAQFKFDDGQIGKKLGRHVKDYGGNPGNPADRQMVIDKIQDIGNNPEKVIPGTFAGQGNGGTRGNVFFRIKGNDVVITKPDGTFVTIMKDGINNPSVKNALKGNP